MGLAVIGQITVSYLGRNFFTFFDRTPKLGERKLSLHSGKESRNELTDFIGDNFYFEWL